MLRSKSAAKVPVCPWFVDVIVHVVASAIVSHPLIVRGVNMGRFRMSLAVRLKVVRLLRRGTLNCLGLRSLRMRLWSVSRNVTSADIGMTASMLLSSAAFFLSKQGY